MNSSTPPLRPATPSTQVPDAASTTRPERPKRPPSPDTADSSKRPRTAAPETTTAVDEDAWHSLAWRTYAYGHDRRSSSPWRPALVAWGWPVPPDPQETPCASST